ncbi:unnamed protein product, partial [Amoebophrya sp. A25]
VDDQEKEEVDGAQVHLNSLSPPAKSTRVKGETEADDETGTVENAIFVDENTMKRCLGLDHQTLTHDRNRSNEVDEDNDWPNNYTNTSGNLDAALTLFRRTSFGILLALATERALRSDDPELAAKLEELRSLLTKLIEHFEGESSDEMNYANVRSRKRKDK